MMKYVHIDATCPVWLAFIIKRLCYPFFIIPVNLESKIEDLIKDNKFDEAKKLIENVEKKYGSSTFTVKLSTRLYRIQLLGK